MTAFDIMDKKFEMDSLDLQFCNKNGSIKMPPCAHDQVVCTVLKTRV
jgi:hypothetical protein